MSSTSDSTLGTAVQDARIDSNTFSYSSNVWRPANALLQVGGKDAKHRNVRCCKPHPVFRDPELPLHDLGEGPLYGGVWTWTGAEHGGLQALEVTPGIAGGFLGSRVEQRAEDGRVVIAGMDVWGEATGLVLPWTVVEPPGRPCSCMRGELADA
ncbi:hypothetical protein CC78DRAFT_616619 [Lojkania enalia]|uniref:Uncharacterized protein n=1 Tax=Lojkania enalia TaxID=147567 RepID=A0A9P4KBM5_9PLEO|nr:hypothetical protein CC78DRAFT_616619 [Didymosphaeria enalia]